MKVLRLLSRAWMGPAKVLRIDSVEELLDSLDLCASRSWLRLEIPIAVTATEGAFALAGGWNPLVAAVQGGPAVLAHFYNRFQPKSLGEFYWVADLDDQMQLGPRQLPWLQPPRSYRGEKGLGPEHGFSLFGPCTEAKISLEHARLARIIASIRADGYLPDRFGDITGYFLVRRNAFRFVVRGGKHRAAALAAIGWSHLPVCVKPGWVRTISLDTLAEWPLVQSGGITEPLACRVFERFFEWNGTQQQRRLIAP